MSASLTLDPDARRFSPLWWPALGALMLAADYAAGPYIQFPVLYLVPIGLAAWFHGVAWALPLAVLMPLARLAYAPLWNAPEQVREPLANAAIRVCVFALVAVLASRKARERERELRMLSAMLAICAHCKKIRNDRQEWEPMEQYFTTRSRTRFTHGICPSCEKAHYPDFAED
jgi:hypothetical protein